MNRAEPIGVFRRIRDAASWATAVVLEDLSSFHPSMIGGLWRFGQGNLCLTLFYFVFSLHFPKQFSFM
jgi:hypothetical protein